MADINDKDTGVIKPPEGYCASVKESASEDTHLPHSEFERELVPELVADSVRNAARHGIVNIFAGIPAAVTAEIDLDAYIEKQLYFIATSGSTLEDMKRMLEKVESGKLDTNLSVAAICGLEGAAEGIRAIENRSIAGKIIVYPACKGLGLVTLEELKEKMPEVADCLNDGLWTNAAEKKLLEMCHS